MEEENNNKKELPKWLNYNVEKDVWTVTTKEGDYTFEEQTGEVVQSCEKMATKLDKDFDALIIPRSSVEPKLTDADLRKIKGSTYFKFKIAMGHVYGMQDLL